MNAETKIPMPQQCLDAMRPQIARMLADVQAMLEGYPMDVRTREDLSSIRFRLKMILED